MGRIHPEYLPDMAVWILKTPPEHEAVVLWRAWLLTSGRNRPVHDLMHLGLAFHSKSRKHFSCLVGVGNAFFKAIGFSFNPQFTDKTAACMVMSEDIYAMLLTHPKIKQFTGKEICRGPQRRD
jgi:hypothetical protein